MYKVFVNEKKLLISKYPQDLEKQIRYDGPATLEIAIDLLENTSCPELNIYGDDLEGIWSDFNQIYKVIEAAGGVVSNQNKDDAGRGFFQHFQQGIGRGEIQGLCRINHYHAQTLGLVAG